MKTTEMDWDAMETSREIDIVIEEYRKTAHGRQRVWSNPTPAEMKRISRRAFELTDEPELFWGCETLRMDSTNIFMKLS